jgi:NAD(P)-dependent dehydrogenase (short-subunit alcohol dehydrogenase family)
MMARKDGRPRVVLITAASRGIGAACARRCAAQGDRVALLARSEEVESLGKELGGVGVRGSIDKPEDLARFVDAAMALEGHLDGLIVSTGHPPSGELLELDDEDWRCGLDLIFLSVSRLAKLITPHMLQSGGGAVVNISAYGAIEPSLEFPVSSAMRAALGAYTKLYADRYAKAGIRMNSLLPGFVDTYPEEESRLNAIPMARYATADEVAQVACFLLGPESAYMTGQSVRVDGGLTNSI